MASITHLSSTQLLSFHRSPSFHPRNTPTLSFNLHPNSSSNLRPISLKPYTSLVAMAVKNLSDTELVTVTPENYGSTEKSPQVAGVFALYDKDGELHFIGLSLHIAASISARRKKIPDLCDSVKVGLVDGPDMEALTQAWKSWIKEYVVTKGNYPPGNHPGKSIWKRRPKKKPRSIPRRHAPDDVSNEKAI